QQPVALPSGQRMPLSADPAFMPGASSEPPQGPSFRSPPNTTPPMGTSTAAVPGPTEHGSYPGHTTQSYYSGAPSGPSGGPPPAPSGATPRGEMQTRGQWAGRPPQGGGGAPGP